MRPSRVTLRVPRERREHEFPPLRPTDVKGERPVHGEEERLVLDGGDGEVMAIPAVAYFGHATAPWNVLGTKR